MKFNVLKIKFISKLNFFLIVILAIYSSCISKKDLNTHQSGFNLVPYSEHFHTYRWTTFYLLKDFVKVNLSEYKISAIGNISYYKNDSNLNIMALDTCSFSLSIINNTTNLVSGTFKLKAEDNPLFRYEWDTLKAGENPTPLLRGQSRVYNNYISYKLMGNQIPEFNTYTVYGDSFTQNEFKGKITVLHFWIYFCLPCQAIKPALESAKDIYKYDKDIQFISFFKDSVKVNEAGDLKYFGQRYTSEKNPDIYHKSDFSYLQIPNSENINLKFNVQTFPIVMIIDQEGIVREIIKGASIDNENELITTRIINTIENLKK